MRMKELEINSEGLLSVDIMEMPESCVIVLSNGKAKFAELPAFAETKIVTAQGLVQQIKWNEGEKF